MPAGAPADPDELEPHVFGEATAETLEEIEAQWQAIKAQEKAARADEV